MSFAKISRMTRDAGQLQRIVDLRRRRSKALLASANAELARLQAEAHEVRNALPALAQQRAMLAHAVGTPVNLDERLRLEYARMLADQALEQARSQSAALEDAMETAQHALATAETGSTAAERRSEKTKALSDDVARLRAQALARKRALLHEEGS